MYRWISLRIANIAKVFMMVVHEPGLFAMVAAHLRKLDRDKVFLEKHPQLTPYVAVIRGLYTTCKFVDIEGSHTVDLEEAHRHIETCPHCSRTFNSFRQRREYFSRQPYQSQ